MLWFFLVRDGKLIGRETYQMDGDLSADTDSELVTEFIKQHYNGIPNVPGEILWLTVLRGRALLEEYLSETAGHKVKNIGSRNVERNVALVQLASGDIIEMVKTIDTRIEAEREREEVLGREIWSLLGKRIPAMRPGI